MTCNTFGRHELPTDIKAGDILVANADGCDITAGKEYTVHDTGQLNAYRWYIRDDVNDRRTFTCSTNFTRKKPVPVIPPMPEVAFDFLNSSDKKTILLAKFKGDRLQECTDGTWKELLGSITNSGTYRLTPREVIDAEDRRKQLLADIASTHNSLRFA